MNRSHFGLAVIALGAALGGCASSDMRHADTRSTGDSGVIYDANTDAYLDKNIYIDGRNVQEASAPPSTGFGQGQYWSDDPEPNRDVYAIPRDTNDSRDLNRSEELRRSNERQRELDRQRNLNDGVDRPYRDNEQRDYEQEEIK